MKISKIKKKKGFTLVELVITIAIIIVLSSISVPIYKSYVKNAKISEGYILLGTIRDAQKQYKAEYGRFFYSRHTCNDTVLGIDARANKYFTFFSAGDGADSYYFNAYVTSKDFGIKTLIYNLSATTGVVFK
ncbi:MAG: prepilin-type N-terminal cleavage/methylation domain-containing protein [Elusimicrobia bacterium]|nr:prepilin-type N-terminal cleavage/methylation domain-containing protein [Elusimicrobiota bacterium]